MPSAMVLATKKRVLADSLKLKDGAMWTDADMKILDKNGKKLQSLLDDFPADKMYLYPVKLSGWN